MQKYKILAEGKNFLVNVNGMPEKMGFFTTRFLEASDQEEAQRMTLEVIRNQLQGVVLNAQSDPPTLIIDTVQKLDEFGDHHVPGSGFSWFLEEQE